MSGIEHAFREEWGVVVATLARRLGDLQAAEDATAEAFAAASAAWARDGVPPNPGGWLTVTAWRKAVDTYRISGRSTAVDPTILNEVTEKSEETVMPEPLGDDRLGLVFTCCHPALAVEARVALTLRFVAGLTTRDIAAAFVVPEATLAQRLVRAKRKIRETGIRLTVPSSPAHLAERLSSVRMVVYLVFNEGPQIALLYRALARLDPSPVVEVNRAVAVGMADGPLAGLAVLAPVLASGALAQYAPLHAAHGFLLDKAGDPERARGAWGRAAETSGNSALRDELLRRHEID